MATKSLGFKKDTPKIETFKRLKVEGFEEEFLNYWKSLGFRKELDKNSKSYASSIKALRKVLSGEFSWAENITLEKLKQCCVGFQQFSNLNIAQRDGGKGAVDLKKLYFWQFVASYSGYSYLRDVLDGKIRVEPIPEELGALVSIVEEILKKKLNRKTFSAGEKNRILKFVKAVDDLFKDYQNKIAFGVDILTLIRGSFMIIDEFRKLKGIEPNVLIYTGNYAAESAVLQAMDKFGYWKIYDKHEDDSAFALKDIEKTNKVLEENKKKEEEELPDIVKRRREEMEKNGIKRITENKEDCSRREAYFNKKKAKRNPFSC